MSELNLLPQPARFNSWLRLGLCAAAALSLVVSSTLQAAVAVVPLYSVDPADGFNSTVVTNHPIHGTIELGQLRRKVFQAGADYVGSLFDPSYPGEQIRVLLKMEPLANGTLGTGGAASFTNGFGSTNPKYHANVNYPSALGNHLAGANLVTGPHAEVSISLAYATWDYGINTSPVGGNESFYTTAVHEILHGIGFLDGNEASGAYNPSPTSFDSYVVLDATQRTLLTGMSQTDRQAALISGNLFFTGPLTMAWNPLTPGAPPKLNAPNPYSSSSSVSHWDPATWNPLGLLLLPSAALGVPEKLYLIAMERGLLYDMGFTAGRPQLSITSTNGTNHISVKAIIGAQYALRTSTNLTSWTSISTNQATSSTLSLVDSGTATSKFYSVEIVPDILSALRPPAGQPASLFQPATPEKPRYIR